MNGLLLMKQAQIHLLCISLLVMGKLTPRLCWLLQRWNYCGAIALDGLACAEFKEFDEHKVELNLTWPMVKSTAEQCTCNISSFQLKFNHQKGCLSLSLITIFWHHVLPLGGSHTRILKQGSWTGTIQFCMRLNGDPEWFCMGLQCPECAYAYSPVCLL